MRKKKQRNETHDFELQRHIHRLGLDSLDSYRDWCANNGFGKNHTKTDNQKERELRFANNAAIETRLKSKKRENRNLHVTALKICEGKVAYSEITQSHLRQFHQTIQDHLGPKRLRERNIESLVKLINHLHSCRAKLFSGSPVIANLGSVPGNTYLEALVLIASHCRSWIRPIEDWKPNTRNSERQFSSLLRHLFDKHGELPVFFDKVWLSSWHGVSATYRKWYIHIGKGASIRKCELPISYTKKMTFHFMNGPKHLSIPQAIRWGQIHALGGDVRLANALFGTRLGESFENDTFWSTVIQWFINNPMLDREHVGPVIDFLQYQRFEPQRNINAQGGQELQPPLQPNLCIRNRLPTTLLRQVNAWHTRLNNENRYHVRQWQASGIPEFELTEGSQKNATSKTWEIRELLGSVALIAEGRVMKHCVASYASSCARGHSSIWTMEVASCGSLSKALTVEVRNSARLICQARGKLNRLPTEKERDILKKWASEAGLRIASYV